MCIDFIDQWPSDDQQDLWVDVVQYSLRHPEFLAKLLDYLGVCGLQPIRLVTIPPTPLHTFYPPPIPVLTLTYIICHKHLSILKLYTSTLKIY